MSFSGDGWVCLYNYCLSHYYLDNYYYETGYPYLAFPYTDYPDTDNPYVVERQCLSVLYPYPGFPQMVILVWAVGYR